MTGHQYLVGVLEEQRLTDMDLEPLRNTRDQIIRDLSSIHQYDPRIYYGGSYGKKTMIKDSFDLDIIIYFPQTDRRSLRDMYESVYYSLKQAGYSIEKQRVALTLQLSRQFHVDVVTGQAKDEDFYYADLYNIADDIRMRTSLKMHIDDARRVKDTIKLMKLWIRKHSLGMHKFAMEQVVISALRDKDERDLEMSFQTVLQYLKSSILNVKLVDSANSNNHIQILETQRYKIAQAADSSYRAENWGDII
ncbi:MAG: nucleotidyltransferase domain-containing protein [Candidatus Marithrix sp.]